MPTGYQGLLCVHIWFLCSRNKRSRWGNRSWRRDMYKAPCRWWSQNSSPLPKLTIGLFPPCQQAFVWDAERSFTAQEILAGDQRCWNSMGHQYYQHHLRCIPCSLLPTPGTSLKAYRAAAVPTAKDNEHRHSCKIFIWNMCVTEQVSHPEIANLYIVQRNTRAPWTSSSLLCWCCLHPPSPLLTFRSLVLTVPGRWPQLATSLYQLSFPGTLSTCRINGAQRNAGQI